MHTGGHGHAATWLHASGRRPCVLRLAARARSSPCLENALSLAHAAFAFAWAQRPEARCHGLRRGRRSYAMWLRASGPRPCVLRLAARARSSPCLGNALSLAHAAFAFAWAQRPEARCHGLRRDAAATPCGCAPPAAGAACRVPRRVPMAGPCPSSGWRSSKWVSACAAIS